MNTTATAHYQTAAELKDQGAVISTMNQHVPGQILNYVPMHNQDVSGGNVRLELPEESKRTLAAAQQDTKAGKKLETLTTTPQAKPASLTLAETLHKRGLELDARMTRRRPQPNRYAALNAMSTSPASAALKPQSVAPAIAPTMTMPLGQLKRDDQANRAGLRLVTSNDAPRATARGAQPLPQSKPLRPAGFARRHEKLCQGMGAFNFG